MVYKEYFPLFY